jgi:hypothetical protein
VNEVRLRRGQIVREGLHTSLTDLRLRKTYKTARGRWHEICPGPALFVVGRDKGKLSHFWRHSYQMARCGRYLGSVVNPDTGVPVSVGDNRLLAADFRKIRIGEIIGVASEREVGAMNPGESKVHRDCAVRCISGGAPPAFLARDASGEVKILLLVGADGRALNREVLRYVAEPLELSGHLLRAGSTLTLKADPTQFRRISE